MSGEQSAFKLLYSEVFKNGCDVNKVMSKMQNQIKCYVKESFPYFLIADNYFYIPCYFTKKAVETFKTHSKSVDITDLKSHVIIIQDWSLELHTVNSANIFTSYAGVELKLIVKQFKVDTSMKKLNVLRYPVNIYRDSEIKNLILSHVNSCQSNVIASHFKSESLPDISKFQSKANVSQGIVKFAAGEMFNQYGFKSGSTPVLDMKSIYKQEKGGMPKSKDSPGKNVKPKVSSHSKPIKKSPKKGAGSIAGKLAKYTPQGKKTIPKKSVGAPRSGPMATPGDGTSEAATAQAKTMKQFKKMLAYMTKYKGSKSKSGKKSKV